MEKLRKGLGAGAAKGALAAVATLSLHMTLLSNDPVAAQVLVWMPLALVMLACAYVIFLLAAVLIGLPILSVLARLECDGSEVLALTGALAGFAVITGPALATGNALQEGWLAFALSALVGGGVSGAVWGAAREKSADQARAPLSNPNRHDDPRILR